MFANNPVGSAFSPGDIGEALLTRPEVAVQKNFTEIYSCNYLHCYFAYELHQRHICAIQRLYFFSGWNLHLLGYSENGD